MSSGIARFAQDSAGGLLISGSTNVFVNGSGACRIGDVIQSHGDSPHTTSLVVTGSNTVFVNGIPVSRFGDVSSCGHQLTGSLNVFSG